MRAAPHAGARGAPPLRRSTRALPLSEQQEAHDDLQSEGGGGAGQQGAVSEATHAGQGSSRCREAHAAGAAAAACMPAPASRASWQTQAAASAAVCRALTNEPSMSSRRERKAWCCCSGVSGSAYPPLPAGEGRRQGSAHGRPLGRADGPGGSQTPQRRWQAGAGSRGCATRPRRGGAAPPVPAATAHPAPAHHCYSAGQTALG